jgi:hypothetical protein
VFDTIVEVRCCIFVSPRDGARTCHFPSRRRVSPPPYVKKSSLVSLPSFFVPIQNSHGGYILINEKYRHTPI